MANRTFYPSQSSANEHKRIFGSFVGAGASAPTSPLGCVESVVRDDEGEYTVTFKDAYPVLLMPHFEIKGAAAGTTVEPVWESLDTDWDSQEIQLVVTDGLGAAVDVATDETILVALDVQNSGTGVL